MFPSRLLLSRSIWKGPHVVPFAFQPLKPGEVPPPIITNARSATILPNFVGRKFHIHNGKIHHELIVTEDMVGHKLGEFSPTRKPFSYKQTKNR